MQVVVFGPFAEPPGLEHSVPSAWMPCGLLAKVPAEQATPALVAAETLGPVLVAAQELVRPEA